ncbi:MAG: hypothetical protein HYZ43_16020, partial [Flavobacteriia bacterium]|nr:hypothetical protein [Flavobacteriia bacterium]
MKKYNLLLGIILSGVSAFAQQVPTTTDPAGAPSGRNSDQFWSRAGNTNVNGTNNTFGTLWNSPIYTQTNGVTRTTLMGLNPSGSITGAFGIGTSLPQAQLHISSFGVGAFDPNGRLFRTDGLTTQINSWSMFTQTPAGVSAEKFRISTRI